MSRLSIAIRSFTVAAPLTVQAHRLAVAKRLRDFATALLAHAQLKHGLRLAAHLNDLQVLAQSHRNALGDIRVYAIEEKAAIWARYKADLQALEQDCAAETAAVTAKMDAVVNHMQQVIQDHGTR